MPDLPPSVPNNQPRKRDTRASACKRGYDRRWQKIRAVMLAKHPLCLVCDGWSEEVHHLDGNPRNNEEANLCPLCKPCHSRITASASS